MIKSLVGRKRIHVFGDTRIAPRTKAHSGAQIKPEMSVCTENYVRTYW